MRHFFTATLLTVFLCACSQVRTTQEINSALVGKSRAQVKEYFGRRPDLDYGQASYVYFGKFADPGDNRTYKTAVVVFSHFEPDTVWSVGFTDQ